MSIKKFTESMNIISMLDDEPNDEGGLTSSELKAKFDEGAVKLKSFINESLIPDVDTAITEAVNTATISSGNMPHGGSAGQVLFKRSSADFDVEFAELPPFPEIPDPLDIVTTEKLTTGAGSGLGLASDMSVESLLGTVVKNTLRIGSCASSGPAAAKVVTLDGYIRETGSVIGVSFSFANSAGSPTLNVNGTGAATVRYAGSSLATPNMIASSCLHLFMFDGSYWQLLNPFIFGYATLVTGSYTGTHTLTDSTVTSRSISVGFIPSTVLVWQINRGGGTHNANFAIASMSHSAMTNGYGLGLERTSSGFTVYSQYASNAYMPQLNGTGNTYIYMAWRN